MSRKEPKRSGGSDQNKAIARWDNEGGALVAFERSKLALAPLGELNHTAELKGQVARFLHQYKDDGRESA
jgi:hypothetical protein